MADRTSPQLVRPEEAERFVGDTVELAKPVVEVRELVETFRSHRIVDDGWVEIVRGAVAEIAVFERQHPGTLPALAGLAADLETLLRVGWSADAQLLDALSAEMVELLPVVVPACIPRPDDERNWAFPSTSSAAHRTNHAQAGHDRGPRSPTSPSNLRHAAAGPEHIVDDEDMGPA
jgi:hypothetical protein